MRLIDADALIERMYHDAFETDTDMQKWDSGCWIRYKLFENAIDAQPTIDAASVVRGEWIEDPEGDWDDADRGEYECSSCGFRMYPYISDEAFREKYKFCPNCGADMRGVTNGNK